MAERGDIAVNWTLSPRLVKVDAPSTEAVMQDVHDTLVVAEMSQNGMDEPQIISSEGKGDLGGGVTVGITSQLKNGQITFAARTASVSAGTVTTQSTTGKKLIDSVATFQTDGVTRGALIVNFADKSVATVISVDSETQITCEALDDGTDDQFDVGDAYKIWNVVQCDLSGGNITAVDDGGSPISPISPTAFTQIVRTSSSSATLRELAAVQYASYQNAVWLDTGSGNSGTVYPMGTREYPVNNLADAVAIAGDKGFSTLEILASITLDGGTDLDGFTIHGHSISNDTVTIAASASVVDCIIQNCTVDGVLDGGATIEGCVVLDLTYLNGLIHNSMLQGTIQLGGNEMARVVDCHSDVPGATTPIIDCGGGGQALSVRNYNGGIKLINKTGSEAVSIDLNSGQIVLDATVTNGVIVCRGVGKLTDDSVGATVVNELLYTPYIVNAVWEEDLTSHSPENSAANILKFLKGMVGGRWQIIDAVPFPQLVHFEADGVAEIKRYDLKDKDGAAIDISKVLIFDRVEA